MYKIYKNFLSQLHNAGKYRKLPEFRQGNNVNFLDFSTNDYLSISKNPKFAQILASSALANGIGATGSRLLSGNSSIHTSFEEQIALDKNTQAALLFNSGFQANISTLAALLDKKLHQHKPIVFFDRLNHASLYQAVFLSNAELVRYSHNSHSDLENKMQKFADDERNKFVITETIFGMDGDIAPVPEIVALCAQYNAFLYLDEAHATGLYGTNGYGLSTEYDLSPIPHLIMGTLSKALGSCGGYIACSYEIKEYLINKASGFIYSTALPSCVVEAAHAAWNEIRFLKCERETIKDLSSYARSQIKALGYDICNSNSNIIPIVIGDEQKCLDVQKELLAQKIIVSAIRPPTVPENTSRIRISLCAHHTKSDVDYLLSHLAKIL
jgi:8-amino-7-oxononanoate synthase